MKNLLFQKTINDKAFNVFKIHIHYVVKIHVS